MFGNDYIQEGDVLAEKYRVERILGKGGMGMVVAAWHLDLQERRALKFMLPNDKEHPAVVAEATERFMREARAISKLQSKHVVKIYDIARLADGVPYIVMEYLEGMDLDALLRSRGGPLSVEETCRYVVQACEAIAEAHGLGIVHRDLKPANLFLKREKDEPCVKVLDFGIAKVSAAAGAQQSLTVTQLAMGTPAYMSPEQVSNTKGVDGRADIWSLGVVLYQLTTCTLPFNADGMPVLFAKILDDREIARPPSLLNPGISPEFDAVVLRCLQKDTSLRYQTIGQLVAALMPFVSGARSSAPVFVPPGNLQTIPMATVRKSAPSSPNSGDALTVPNAASAATTPLQRPNPNDDPGQTPAGGVVKSVPQNTSVRNAIVASSITAGLVAGFVVWFFIRSGGKDSELVTNPPPTTIESTNVPEKTVPSAASAPTPEVAPVTSSSAAPKPTNTTRVPPPKSTSKPPPTATTAPPKSSGNWTRN